MPTMAKNVPARRVEAPETLADRLTRAVLDLASEVPDTSEHKSRGPDHRARAIASSAANRAALAAGTLALPPGPTHPANSPTREARPDQPQPFHTRSTTHRT